MWRDGEVNLSTENRDDAVSEFGSFPILYLRALSLLHPAPHLSETVNMMYVIYKYPAQMI